VALGNAPHPSWLAGVLHSGPRWPLAARQAAAVALDAAHATPAQLAQAVRVLRPGGRLVAPAWAPLPEGVRELARDATEWVAEAAGSPPAHEASPLVTLRRRS
jgi:threonine dehydrogenase-like Zn-dependent dehydrogenase